MPEYGKTGQQGFTQFISGAGAQAMFFRKAAQNATGT
jgi:hypothetical protein|tara:strand:+ start:500 stop:610 length:111 start_codon:yes stop_codon:yes gene_type:complete